MMSIVIIGLGSIAGKHIASIRELQPNAEMTALRSGHSDGVKERGVVQVQRWEELPVKPDFFIISNPTHLHGETIEKALEYRVPLFVEKPPLHSLEASEELLKKIKAAEVRTYTAFNMRFLPLLQWLKQAIEGRRVCEVSIYCGSWLPGWRKGRDYRSVYSSKREMGGGVHLDLIHELDYLRWLFGEPDSGFSSIRKLSDLEITSADHAHYCFHYPQMTATVTLNYFRRDAKRTAEIVFDDDRWYADLLTGKITDMNGNLLYQSEITIAGTYHRQMNYFLQTLETGEPFINDLQESIKTLKLCLDT